MLCASESGIESAVGIDISEWHIQQARAQQSRSDALHLDFERLDFNTVGQRYPDTFDLALARDTLHYATDLTAALRSIRRSLRLGGHLLATDWVQIRPALPAEMRRLASTVWLTAMQPLSSYGALLRETGFECQWYQLEGQAMFDYFCVAEERAASKQAEQSTSTGRAHYDRICEILHTLTDMSTPRTGIISWLFYVAKAI